MLFSRLMPALRSYPDYSRADLGADVIAGITVAVMLVPQGMAYAMLAGLPPVVGLYAAMVPMAIYALLGTSRHLSVGPAAMDSLLVLAGVSLVAAPGSPEYIAAAVLLMLMVGAMQFTLGLLRAGVVVNFLSQPVVSGFMSAAALIIASSQLGHLLGVRLPRSTFVLDTVREAIGRLGQVNLATFALGAIAIALLVVLKRSAPRTPRALVVVVGGTLAVILLDLDSQGVAVIGAVPGGLPAFAVPAFDVETILTLAPVALTLALVGYMEAISVSRFFARKHGYNIDADRELFALGAANMGGAFFGGFPVTGGLSRAAVNDQAGARTPVSSLVTAGLMVVTLLALTSLFHMLPKAILAAIIIAAATGLINVADVRRLWRTDRVDLGLLLLTFAATLLLGIQTGILVGIGASIFTFVARRTHPHCAELGRVPHEGVWRAPDEVPDVLPEPGVLVLRFDVSFYFGNVQFLRDRMQGAMQRDDLLGIVLDMSGVNAMDSSAATLLDALVGELDSHKIDLRLAAVKGRVRARIRRSSALSDCFDDRIHLTVEKAVRAIVDTSAAGLNGC
ncbi:MAG: SulP family sulfate permease [Bradymonadia bacterium]|jgi:SulP family sulfate permease